MSILDDNIDKFLPITHEYLINNNWRKLEIHRTIYHACEWSYFDLKKFYRSDIYEYDHYGNYIIICRYDSGEVIKWVLETYGGQFCRYEIENIDILNIRLHECI